MSDRAVLLIDALEYIEEHIADEMMIQDIADSCFVSLSGLQKTFKYVFHLSINEYILRRKFTCAARDLLTTGDTILEIALKYGYSSPESFTRGFRKVWGITPSEYRKTRHFSGHTPKLRVVTARNTEEGMIMNGTKYDLTELYDVLQERKNNAYVCVDLSHLDWINKNLGHKAGDEALLELMRRVENACDEDDILLRIGGDEFVVFTNSVEMQHANDIVTEVSAQNGQNIRCGELEFPIKLHIGAFKGMHEKHVNAADMFNEIADGIKKVHEE